LRENIGNESFVNFNRKIIFMFFSVKAAESCLAVATVNTLSIQLSIPSFVTKHFFLYYYLYATKKG
jgi:hypothetical protein